MKTAKEKSITSNNYDSAMQYFDSLLFPILRSASSTLSEYKYINIAFCSQSSHLYDNLIVATQ